MKFHYSTIIDDETGEEVPATSEVAGTGIMTSAQGKLFVNKENGKLTIAYSTYHLLN